MPSPDPAAPTAAPALEGAPVAAVTALEGVAADQGLALLGDLVDEVVFLDRSAFLPASFLPVVDWLRHVPVSPLLTTRPTAPREPSAARTERHLSVAFAPEHGDHAHVWARQHGRRLLAAPAAITERAADKIDSLPLLAEAGVAVPDHVLIPASDRRPASAYWPGGWEQAVLQRRENNLIGQGTVLIPGPGRLAAALARWEGHELKLSRLVAGPSLTVSACVGADRTVVSAVSHQLVGLPALTPGWGTHCGNQLLDPADLPAPLYTSVRETARKVGEVLRRHGFRGVFGLDLLVDGERPLVVEINPRFQTVVSLVQAAEAAAGLLPSLGLHILACLLPAFPSAQYDAHPVPPLSQIVVHAPRPGRLGALPRAGRYQLTEDGALHGPCPDTALSHLADDAAVLWPHAAPGPVRAGDELVLVQTRQRLCPLTARPGLGPRAQAWTEQIRTLVGDPA
ncbi:ATP-grasp domain-containing protein [Streptomyces sp. CoH27]|uniref:ATP-grasp domain-containing protein n=1 Tax=Streptomyces sp. CoH27 TaxID=2875763 RepID=UPI001CD2F5FF|nr:ATP-grasp domain-containing protein [Streptomyces sp. CoH27]